jgi:hypothetical protein
MELGIGSILPSCNYNFSVAAPVQFIRPCSPATGKPTPAALVAREGTFVPLCAAPRRFSLARISDRLRLMQSLDELPKFCG